MLQHQSDVIPKPASLKAQPFCLNQFISSESIERVSASIMASATAQASGNTKKKLILNAFVESCSGHQSPGLWRHPRDRSWNFNNVSHWVELAKLLERGKFHGVFIADVLVSHRELPQILQRSLTVYRARTMCTKAHGIQTLPWSRERSGPSMSHWQSFPQWQQPRRTSGSASP